MEPHTTTDRPRTRTHTTVAILTTLLLTGGVVGTIVLGAAVVLPANGVERAAAVHGKKPRPTTSIATTASPSPTSSDGHSDRIPVRDRHADA